jgi:hypothetical protein
MLRAPSPDFARAKLPSRRVDSITHLYAGFYVAAAAALEGVGGPTSPRSGAQVNCQIPSLKAPARGALTLNRYRGKELLGMRIVISFWIQIDLHLPGFVETRVLNRGSGSMSEPRVQAHWGNKILQIDLAPKRGEVAPPTPREPRQRRHKTLCKADEESARKARARTCLLHRRGKHKIGCLP